MLYAALRTLFHAGSRRKLPHPHERPRVPYSPRGQTTKENKRRKPPYRIYHGGGHVKLCSSSHHLPSYIIYYTIISPFVNRECAFSADNLRKNTSCLRGDSKSKSAPLLLLLSPRCVQTRKARLFGAKTRFRVGMGNPYADRYRYARSEKRVLSSENLAVSLRIP